MNDDVEFFPPESAMTISAALAWARHESRMKTATPPRQMQRQRQKGRQPSPRATRSRHEPFGAWADGTPYAIYYEGLYELASGKMRKNGTRKRADEEGAEQRACVRWFRAAYPQYEGLLQASAGGVFTSISQKVKMREMGYVNGTPDFALLVVTEMWPGCFMEMKKTRGGKVSTEQHNIADMLESQGYEVHRNVRGFKEFREIVDNYLCDGEYTNENIR